MKRWWVGALLMMAGCDGAGEGAVDDAGPFEGRWMMQTDLAVMADGRQARRVAEGLRSAGAGGVVVLVDRLTTPRGYVVGDPWRVGVMDGRVAGNLAMLGATFGQEGVMVCVHNAHRAPGTFDVTQWVSRMEQVRAILPRCEVLLGWEERGPGLGGYRTAAAMTRGGAWVNFIGGAFEEWEDGAFGLPMHSWVVSARGIGRPNWDGRLDVTWGNAAALLASSAPDTVAWWAEAVVDPTGMEVWLDGVRGWGVDAVVPPGL